MEKPKGVFKVGEVLAQARGGVCLLDEFTGCPCIYVIEVRG